MSTNTQFYINGYAIVITEESKISYKEISFGTLIVSQITTSTIKVVTKATLSIAMQTTTVKSNIFISGVFYKTIELNPLITVKELRTKLSLNSSQFFFSKTGVIF